MKKLTALIVTILALLVFASVPTLAQAQDWDGDGVLDLVDNCPWVPNPPPQTDTNSDGVGDACDTDIDGIHDSVDNCPGNASSNIRDSDADGVGNVCDTSPFPAPPPTDPISGTSLGALHACIVTAFFDPSSGFIKASTAVFDTGADVFLLGGSTAQALDNLQPITDFFDPAPAPTKTVSNVDLDSRNWGLQLLQPGQPPYNGLRVLPPEAEVKNLWVRVLPDNNDTPILVGAPFANQVYAYIDHTNQISIGPENCPAVTFWPSATGTPTPLFYVNLQRFGTPNSGSSTTPTRGERYYIRGMRFKNGGNKVESQVSPTPIPNGARFLYDTGNKTTQISESMAAGVGGLGINLSTCTPPNCVWHVIDKVNRKCYKIDRVEIDAADNSYQYVINDPVVCVVPDGSVALGLLSDANIGMNYFETTQVLFDGPGSRLGLFRGTKSGAPSPPQNLRIISGS